MQMDASEVVYMLGYCMHIFSATSKACFEYCYLAQTDKSSWYFKVNWIHFMLL